MPTKFLQNITPRAYQQEIFETCINKNCLVVLPTGIGKTLIALMLAIERMIKFPGKKVLFLAPTKPLAEQHLTYFKKYLPELFADMQLFTGSINTENRKKIWKTADIIFSTPQCIANDLKKNQYDLKEVCLLVEDEAHRCMKNYDYNFVAQRYQSQSENPRILGLTASPGSESVKIKQICRNLSIEEVEIRTRESLDVKQYLQELKFEKIILDFPPEFEEMRHILKILFERYVEELRFRKVLFGPATKTGLIMLQKKISSSLTRGNQNYNYLLGASACAQAIKLQHALDLLETQTLESFNKYLKNLFDQAAKKQSKGVVKLVAKPEFNIIFMRSNELLSKGIEHPKLKELKKIIEIEKENNPKNKLIIFTQFRDTAALISKNLNQLSGIKSKVFIGQANKSKGGLTQKEQKKIIEDFSLNKINVLCATSLHPDEYIILKKDKKIMIKKIGEFVNQFLKENENTKKINNWETLSTNGKKILFKPITNVHKHQAKNNMVNLKLSSGFDCQITNDHEIFTFEQKNNFIKSKPEINKFVAISKKCENIEQTEKIDTIKEIYKNCKKNDVEKLFGSLIGLTQAKIRILKTDFKILPELNKKELSITNLSKLTKKDYSTTMNCLKRLAEKNCIKQKTIKKNNKKISKITEKGIKYLKFLKWLLENISYKKGKYKFKLINKENNSEFDNFFPQYINVNYGKIKFPRFLTINKYLAAFLGFYVSEGHSRKTKNTSGIFLAARKKNIQKMMKDSIEKGLKLKTRTNWKGVAIDSQISYYLIKDVLKAGIGSYNKEVPEAIFTAPTNIKWAFLKAYFLGDGHLGKDRIVLTTVSRKLIVGLMFLLRSLGIEKITLHNQKHIYRLNVYESLPFAKIKEKNPKKSHSYYALIPTALNSKKAFKKYQNFYSNSKSYIKSRKNGKWENDLCFDYIKRIDKIKNPDFVYDITVKDTKNFIGGTGLFCLHNCIAEEGLDIPEVNAVVFYEPVPSAIRAIQRAGRTARLMKGKLIILITKGTRDEASYYVSRARDKKMHTAIQSIKQDFVDKRKKEIQKRL